MLNISRTDRQLSNPRRVRRNLPQLDALARADLLAIARLDFGTSRLPDNEQGEQFLRALLLKGMPASQAPDVAPWARRNNLLWDLLEATNNQRRKPPGPDRLGEMIDFSFDKLKTLKRDYGIAIKHIAPFDAHGSQVRAFWKAERQEKDRERKRKERRKKLSADPATSERAALVRKAVGWRWTSVAAIMDAIAPILRDQRNRPLSRPALKVAVHRALDELRAVGLVEDKIGVRKHGGTMRFARGADLGPQHIPHTTDRVTRVTRNKNASAQCETP